MASAAQQAYSKIRQGILEGDFDQGARLRESELVDYCGVSRTPIRAALQRLIAEDLVVAVPNQGVRVRTWSEHEIEELYALRSMLEGYAAARSASNITPAELAELSALVEETDVLLNKSKITADEQSREFLRLNAKIHKLIWLSSRSERLIGILSLLVDQSLQMRTARIYSSSGQLRSHHHHQDLLAALTAGDGAWAERTMFSHIRAARHALAADSAD